MALVGGCRPAGADELARHHWDRLSRLPQDLVIANPRPDLMFDDRLYRRGALTLHAIRGHLGDHAFFEMLRGWTAASRYSTVTTKQFQAHLEDFWPSTGEGSSTAVLDRWLREPALPALG